MADTKDPSSLADRLRDALAAVPAGAAGRGPSELREQVRAVFDRLAADRERGASWDGLAAAFAALGVATAAGKPPTGADLRNAYHAERYARGGKRRKRRSRRGAPATRAPPAGAAQAGAPAPVPMAPAAAAKEPPPAAADPELARRLGAVRTLTDVPPADFGAGWRRKGERGDG